VLPLPLLLPLFFVALIAGSLTGTVPLAAADTPSVTIIDYAFQPTMLTITPGQTVTWTNTGSEPHNAVAYDGTFSSPVLSQGQTFSFTFPNAGTYAYQCSIHPWMTGSIVVGQSSAAPSSPAGQATPSPTTPPPTGGQSGGFSTSFTVGGSVASPATYALADLQALPSQMASVQYTSGQGQQQHTYQGVRLYDLLMAASPQFVSSRKNDKLNWYVHITGVDNYQTVIAWGEIDPGFEGKNILVAYEKDGQLLGQGDGMAELVVPGDTMGGRYVSSITSITVSPASS
jgi:plastocyanin